MLASTSAFAQNTPVTEDCSKIVLDVPDDPSLTREERIELLDKKLLEALARAELCDPIGAAAASGDGSASEELAGTGTAEDAASADAQAEVDSTPAGEVQGDEKPAEEQDTTETETETETETAATDPAAANNAEQPGRTPGNDPDADDNDKIPDDIPSANNDDIIAKQFRQAAIDETDPVAKAKLWNEYRRYKGLPEKEPES